MPVLRRAMLGTALLLAATLAPTLAAPAADNTRGAVEQSGGNIVPQKPSLPNLNLNDAQRRRISRVLTPANSQIEFKMKTTKTAKSFNPQIGAKLPASVKPLGIPSELTQKIPQLANYGYDKMKGQILLVNAMTGKIAAIIPVQQPQTTGQK